MLISVMVEYVLVVVGGGGVWVFYYERMLKRKHCLLDLCYVCEIVKWDLRCVWY